MINTPNAKNPMMLSLQEFKDYTINHQDRVLKLGLSLFNEYQFEFSAELNLKTVDAFLKLHDYAKTQKLDDGVEQIEILYQFYGVNKSDLPENEKYKILSAINYINYQDSQNALKFFQNYNLINENGEFTTAAEELLLIEKIADLVDRGENSMSKYEFNKKLVPASQILKNEKWASYAHFLETHYLNVIKIS